MAALGRHKLIIGLVAVMLAVGVWLGLSQASAPAPALLTTQAVSGSPAGQELVSTLLALRAVKLDGTIFNDPAFLSLQDFSTQIVPEAVGRQNPFAPLGTANATTSASTPPNGGR